MKINAISKKKKKCGEAQFKPKALPQSKKANALHNG